MEQLTVGSSVSLTILTFKPLRLFSSCWVSISSLNVRDFALSYCIFFVVFGCCSCTFLKGDGEGVNLEERAEGGVEEVETVVRMQYMRE